MKRIMSISLVLIMLTLYVFTIPAFALDRQSKIISGGAREATAEQIAKAETKIEISRNAIPGGAREATEEQMENVEEKNHTARQTRSIYALGVKYYGQETSTSCGPACVRMALSWLSDNSYSEDEIRNGTNWNPSVGTYLSDLVDYLNQEQQNNHYVCRYREPMDTMTEDIFYSILDASVPPIVGVVESAADGWPYDGDSGHFVVVSGVNDTRIRFRISDPWAGYINDPDNDVYYVSEDDMYAGYSCKNIGYAY